MSKFTFYVLASACLLGAVLSLCFGHFWLMMGFGAAAFLLQQRAGWEEC